MTLVRDEVEVQQAEHPVLLKSKQCKQLKINLFEECAEGYAFESTDQIESRSEVLVGVHWVV